MIVSILIKGDVLISGVQAYRGPVYHKYFYRVFDEDDSDHDERLVGNPIYSDSLPGPSENTENTERESYDVLRHNVGAIQRGVIPLGA